MQKCNSDGKGNLSEKQIRAGKLFLKTNGNIKRTCESLGIKRMIFYRWLKIPVFKKYIDLQIEIIHDYLLQIAWDVLNRDGNIITTTKTEYRKGKVYKTITTKPFHYSNRIILNAIITVFEVMAARGVESAMEWCKGYDKPKSLCNVFQLPRALKPFVKEYKIAA